MSFTDSDFRENPKYYGDIIPTFPANNSGMASSSSYIAFGYEKANIGYVATDFFTNISEKAAQGRKAEYGSKVYTTDKIHKCIVNNQECVLTSLLFSPFDDSILITGHETGVVNIWNLPQQHKNMADIEKPSLTISDLTAHVSCLTYHRHINNVLAIGGNGSIFLSDLNKNGAIVNKVANLEAVVASLEFNRTGSLLRGVTRNGKFISYDPRTNATASNILSGDLKCIPEGFHHLTQVSNDDNIILVTGQTGFRESIVQTFDVSKNDFSTPLYKENYNHKNCLSLSHYDVYTNLFYVSFRSTADAIVYNVLKDGSLDKQCVYHNDHDTFYALNVLPKHSVKKREINKVIKLAKDRIQLLIHHRGGKLIYDQLNSEISKPLLSSSDYLESNKNVENINYDSICKLMPEDFEEKEERKTSLYLHIAGKEPLNIQDRYYNIVTSNTVNMPLGHNIKCNSRYCIFPSKATGGGALGIIDYNNIGRQRQKEIRAHSEQISTFDVSLLNEQLVATGAHDGKVYVWKLPSNLFESDNNKSKSQSTKQANEDVGIEKLHTFQHEGKVTYVGFHKRFPNLLITADRGLEGSTIKMWNIAKGEKIWQWDNFSTNGGLITDIEFEPLYGLIAAVSSQDKSVKIIDIKNKKILLQWEPNESMRDIKLTWILDNSNKNNLKQYFTRLMTSGFRKGSVRSLSIWDLEEIVKKYYSQALYKEEKSNEEEEDIKQNENNNSNDMTALMEYTFGVSNAIPITYYDSDNNLVYLSSVGDRKIKVYEINHTLNSISEMNQSFNSKEDILGTAYKPKQTVDASIVEQTLCFKLSKTEISPISFTVPRKRKEYFQDDLYVETIDYFTPIIDDVATFVGWLNNNDSAFGKVNLKYINLQPKNLTKLSEAPEEDLSELQKKRNSVIEKMEKEKMTTTTKSSEQAIMAFSKIADYAPAVNRWDAVNIGTEVAEDEWNDSD